MSNDLHQATGSMPAQPEEEKIDAPVEEKEDEINEPSEDVPNGDALAENEGSELAPEDSPEGTEGASEGDNAQTDTNTAPEGESDPNGPEPVVEPINE